MRGKCSGILVLGVLGVLAGADTTETPYALAHRLCHAEDLGIGALAAATCYENVYDAAVKAHVDKYTRVAAAETQAAVIRAEISAWSDIASVIANATTNTTDLSVVAGAIGLLKLQTS